MTSPDLWNAAVALVAAIIGALVGAVPAFILARRASKEVLERDRAARRDAERAVGMRIHVKLGTIVNSILTIQRQLNTALANPPIAGAEPWQCVEPVIGFAGEERIQFDAEEASLFLAAGKGDFAEALLLIARRHAVQAEVLKEYGRLREQLRRDMPPPVAVEGNQGHTVLNHEELMRVRPQMVGLNTLLAQLIGHLDEDIDLALTLAADFGPILRPYFDDPKYPGFVVPDNPDAILAIRRYGQMEPTPAPSV